MSDKTSRAVARNTKAVAAVKAGDRQVNYRIQGAPGLHLSVHPGGKKTWMARYQIGRGAERRGRWIEIGTANHVSLADACDQAAEIVKNAKKGVDPLSVRQLQREADTFASLGDQWVAFKVRSGRSQAYVNDMALRLKRLPRWFLSKKAHAIERLDVTACLEEFAKKGKGTETNRVQALVSSVLAWGLSEGRLTDNVARGVKKRFPENLRKRVMNDEEVRSFWQAIDRSPASQASKIAMKLCLVLGQRPKEICQLRQRKLVLDGPAPMLTIEAESTKNRNAHVLPLPAVAVDLLRQAVALFAGNEWVFPAATGNNHLNRGVLSTIMIRTRNKDVTLQGMRDVRLYDCRKTMATFLGDQGYESATIGRLLNHKKIDVTTAHYNHASYLTQKRQMIEAWADHLEEVLAAADPAPDVVWTASEINA